MNDMSNIVVHSTHCIWLDSNSNVSYYFLFVAQSKHQQIFSSVLNNHMLTMLYEDWFSNKIFSHPKICKIVESINFSSEHETQLPNLVNFYLNKYFLRMNHNNYLPNDIYPCVTYFQRSNILHLVTSIVRYHFHCHQSAINSSIDLQNT